MNRRCGASEWDVELGRAASFVGKAWAFGAGDKCDPVGHAHAEQVISVITSRLAMYTGMRVGSTVAFSRS